MGFCTFLASIAPKSVWGLNIYFLWFLWWLTSVTKRSHFSERYDSVVSSRHWVWISCLVKVSPVRFLLWKCNIETLGSSHNYSWSQTQHPNYCNRIVLVPDFCWALVLTLSEWFIDFYVLQIWCIIIYVLFYVHFRGRGRPILAFQTDLRHHLRSGTLSTTSVLEFPVKISEMSIKKLLSIPGIDLNGRPTTYQQYADIILF